MKAAGLASLTGGGRGNFPQRSPFAIARGKESAEEYLDVHRTWHTAGPAQHLYDAYGHVETLADRVDHLRQLRALQDETNGFTALIPLAYQRRTTTSGETSADRI